MNETPPPVPLSVQLSGHDAQGQVILSVLAKRTYLWRDERWVVDEEQIPLYMAPQADDACPELMLHDTDLIPFKTKTDVVIRGHAYGRGQSTMDVTVQLADQPPVRIRVTGDRVGRPGLGGRLEFSAPAAIEKIPLRYSHAYGGTDRFAEAKYGNPFLEWQALYGDAGIDLEQCSPYRYPRNPAGRGYLVECPAEGELPLPNLEDPQQLLTPENILVRDVRAWGRMPRPRATDWWDYGWYPRNALWGLTPEYDPMVVPRAEIDAGDIPEAVLQETQPTREKAFAALQGASWGLRMPLATQPPKLRLVGVHPQVERLRLQLPTEIPRLWTDGRQGTWQETAPVVHTVEFFPDTLRVALVWRGAAPAKRPYLPEELDRMPFRVEW